MHNRFEIKNNKEKICCIILMIFYVIFTVFMSFKHEIWFDEAQAWNISRDFSPAGIIDMMKYEGHSSLWSFILYPFSHLGFPVQTLGFISIFFMSVSVFLLLFKSPFPFYLKFFTVISAGFIYINVTVSRVYCLIPLILFLIAIIYPKRFEKPIIYGFLVALLCNTHAMMCGVVGILGIYMLIDLFDNLKNPKLDKKHKLMQIIGLLTAGFGVLIFLLQISDALFSNDIACTNGYDITKLFNLMQLTNYLFTGNIMPLEDNLISNILIILRVLLYVFTSASFFIILFLLRKSNRSISMILFSITFEMFVNCVLWYFNPNRAPIVVLTVLFFVWIAFNQEDNKNINISDEVLKKFKITEFLLRFDKNKKKTITVLISVVYVLTIPLGVYYIYNDYNYIFCPSKDMCDYIEENIEDDTFIINNGVCYTISAYNPDIKLLHIYNNEISTVSYHKLYDINFDIYSDDFYKKISEIFPDSQTVYYIAIVEIDDIPTNDNRIKEIYRTEKGMPFPSGNNVFALSLLEINLDEVRKQADITQ